MKNVVAKKIVMSVAIFTLLIGVAFGLCGCGQSAEKREAEITAQSERIANLVEAYVVPEQSDCIVQVYLTGSVFASKYDGFTIALKAGTPKQQMVDELKGAWLNCQDYPYSSSVINYTHAGDQSYWIADRKLKDFIIDDCKDYQQQQDNDG